MFTIKKRDTFFSPFFFPPTASYCYFIYFYEAFNFKTFKQPTCLTSKTTIVRKNEITDYLTIFGYQQKTDVPEGSA